MNNSKENLALWAEKVNQTDLPIFNRTIHDIISLSDDEASSVSQMARVVLHDTTMTARVLKLANTIYYNPGSHKINTVSRAIVVLGVDSIRTLCLTVALVDTFVRSTNRKFLLRELARSLHAATQARSFAQLMNNPAPEEVFVASLLYHLGDMVFWCFSDKEAQLIDTAIKKGVERETVEKEVLGFSLHELTEKLVKDWRLSDLLEKTLEPGEHKTKWSKLVMQCHELAVAAEQGWESEAVQKVTKDISKLSGLSDSSVRKFMYENVVRSARISHQYGAEEALKLIPPLKARSVDLPEDEEEHQEYNPSLQLDILREISSLLFEKRDFNLLMGMVLEGIYRGIGMDRAIFALLSPDRKLMKAKFVIGREKDFFYQKFRFKLFTPIAKIFQHVVDEKKGVWVGEEDNPLNKLLTKELIRLLGGMEFFAMPVVVGKNVLGIIYGDRIPSGRRLDKQSFANFEHFTQQASLGLEHISFLKEQT